MRKTLPIAVVVAVVLAAAVFFALRAAARGPLAGPTRHDFGVVPIDTPPAEVAHTFHLVNDGDESLVLSNVKRSCNCASVETSTDIVEPGGSLDVTVTMTLRSASEKKSRITLVFEQGEREVIRNLFVTARGERETPPAQPPAGR